MVDNWGKEEPVAKGDVAWYKLPWLDSFFVDVGPREHESAGLGGRSALAGALRRWEGIGWRW